MLGPAWLEVCVLAQAKQLNEGFHVPMPELGEENGAQYDPASGAA